MDHQGHIALTDFGLSKENVTSVFTEQLKTLCGTAEYVPFHNPRLRKRNSSTSPPTLSLHHKTHTQVYCPGAFEGHAVRGSSGLVELWYSHLRDAEP